MLVVMKAHNGARVRLS